MHFGPRMKEGEEANCLLCHSTNLDMKSRAQALASSSPEWSIAATLGDASGSFVNGAWQWKEGFIDDDGEADLHISPATEEHCGACHGEVHNSRTPLSRTFDSLTDWTTAMTGQVFSGQTIRFSGINLKNKDALRQPWDVHASRMVECSDCHYASERPSQLAGDVTEAKAGELRRCESCHALEHQHDWLPETEKHMEAVACEACHIPTIHLAALQQLDHTVVNADGTPGLVWRGIEHSNAHALPYIEGYEPLLGLGTASDGTTKLMPYNVVGTWRWADGEKDAPIAVATVRAAWLKGDAYRKDVLEVFDTNSDGTLNGTELRLDTPAKTKAITANLEALGASNPHVVAEARSLHLHHNVTYGEWANHDCTTCHTIGSTEKTRAFSMGTYVPADVIPTVHDTAGNTLGGAINKTEDGGLAVVQETSAVTMYRSLAGGKE